MTYLLAAVTASGIFILACWRSKNAPNFAATQGRHGLPIDPLWGARDSEINASSAQTDVGAAMGVALRRLAPVLARQLVQAEVATPFGLPVRMRGTALVDLLEELLTAAIHSAPASRLLLTAAPHGDRVHVSITDDMPGADPAIRLGSIRSLIDLVTMRGGALDIDVRPTEGTTMTLRLAAATEERRDKKDPPPPEVAMPLSGASGGFSAPSEC